MFVPLCYGYLVTLFLKMGSVMLCTPYQDIVLIKKTNKLLHKLQLKTQEIIIKKHLENVTSNKIKWFDSMDILSRWFTIK